MIVAFIQQRSSQAENISYRTAISLHSCSQCLMLLCSDWRESPLVIMYLEKEVTHPSVRRCDGGEHPHIHIQGLFGFVLGGPQKELHLPRINQVICHIHQNTKRPCTKLQLYLGFARDHIH